LIRKEKKVIITLDYELFLGKDSGNLYTSLINPTEKILEKLNNYNESAIFFIDVPFVIYLKDSYPEEYQIVKKQLIGILRQGSYLGLHIHSQWLDAAGLSKNRWTFKTFDHYRFHSLSKDKQADLFTNCYNVLAEILKEALLLYNCDQKKIIHFRAGGWSIQPFSIFKGFFEKYGIVHDFSVKPAVKMEMLPYHYFDFENVSIKKSSWSFFDDPCTSKDSGSFIEYPVTTLKLNSFLYTRIKRLIVKIFPEDGSPYGDGLGLSQSLDVYQKQVKNKNRSLFKRIGRVLNTTPVPLVFENYVFVLFKYLLKIIYLNKDLAVIVGHPKSFSDLSIKNLDYLLRKFKTYIPK